MAKSIAFFSDGTGNTKDFGPDTNVELLFTRVLDETGPGMRQMARYDAGVGIEFGDLFGKAFGKGISQNIKDGYDYLAEVYEPGDRIFLFGFSRGAYTARSIGGMLGRIGLPARHQRDGGDLRIDHAARKVVTDKAYAIYKIADDAERDRRSEAFRRDHAWREHGAPEARAPWLIGVWDTVRSLGIPLGFRDYELSLFPHRFHDHDLNPHVAHAYHALSIDDERLQFLPTIWNEPTAAQRLADRTGRPNPQRFEQVWFPGVHSDVGGGYANRNLADVTLRWMIERAASAGLLFAPPFDSDPAQGPPGVSACRRGPRFAAELEDEVPLSAPAASGDARPSGAAGQGDHADPGSGLVAPELARPSPALARHGRRIPARSAAAPS